MLSPCVSEVMSKKSTPLKHDDLTINNYGKYYVVFLDSFLLESSRPYFLQTAFSYHV